MALLNPTRPRVDVSVEREGAAGGGRETMLLCPDAAPAIPSAQTAASDKKTPLKPKAGKAPEAISGPSINPIPRAVEYSPSPVKGRSLSESLCISADRKGWGKP